VDILEGKAGTDAFFANTNAGTIDTLVDKGSDENLIEI
jgi:hypothetical protein